MSRRGRARYKNVAVSYKIRARAEHPFRIVKHLFRHSKLRYQGLAKNGAQLEALFAPVNLVIAKKALVA